MALIKRGGHGWRGFVLLDVIRVVALLCCVLLFSGCKYKPPEGHTYGTLAGVPIRVPNDEIFLWSRDGQEGPFPTSPAECKQKVGGGVLFLRWPELVARNAENNDEFEKTFWKSLGPTPWLDVGFRNYKNTDGMYIAKVARGRLIEQVGMSKYQKISFSMNDVHGLSHARVTNDGAKYYHELDAYWIGDLTGGGKVETYITCGNGVRDRPAESLRGCKHMTALDEMGVTLSIRYPEDMLPQWREIQDGVKQHFLSFRYDCK